MNKLKPSHLSHLDELIIAQAKKLELLKLHKKGLTQMFPNLKSKIKFK